MNVRRWTRWSVSVVAVLAIGACGRTSTPADGTPPDGTDPPVTDTTPSTTDVPTTTTTTSTTAAPTTTESPVPEGWRPVDTESLPSVAFPPCCGSNWVGVPSPPLPGPGEPFADGLYAVASPWRVDGDGQLLVAVNRFEQCGLLYEFACEYENEDGTFLPESMGIDDAGAAVKMTLSLDHTLRVVLVGFDQFDGAALLPAAEGNGADLAEFAAALTESYAAAVAAPLAAGRAQDEIISALYATPAYGFSGPPEFDAGTLALRFEHGSAPPILMQAPFDYSSGSAQAVTATNVLFIPAFEVSSGVATVYVYAGYYP